MDGANQYDTKTAAVLDDNPQMRGILRSILNGMGIRAVAEFSDPESMQHYLQGHHVDLSIIDIVLNSEIDGLELSNSLRHDPLIVNPTMPIIVVTGYANVAVIDQAINLGIDELITKPLRARDLIARVDKVLNRPRTYIRTPSGYFGPDRRRRQDPLYNGPERRVEDQASPVLNQQEARRAIARMKPDPFVEQRSVDEAIVYLD